MKHWIAGFILLIPALAARAEPISGLLEPTSPSDRGPKWEAGIAGAALTTADYPGSDEYQTLALPAPYFVYHGRVLRADDQEGSRLRQRLTPNLEIGVSGSGALASDSGDSEAREGMPDLDYLIELGPQLRLSYDGPRPSSKFVVKLPIRGVASLGSSISWRGVVLAPELGYLSERFASGRLALRTSLASAFASTAQQRYFYAVAPQFATPERPAYEAQAGYLGSSVDVSATYRFTPRVRGFAALAYSSYAGAANRDSPLLRTEHGYTAVIGFSWSFYQSTARAED